MGTSFFKNPKKGMMNDMTENNMKEEIKNDEVNEEIEEIEEQEVWRVTTMKANGSVWTKTYNDVDEVAGALNDLVFKFPHIIISRQTLKLSPQEYKRNQNGRQRQES
tara:strand:- start:894 stop:1214 length:321 start_codon:yes stop_codon:yes gene_type:complete